MPTTEKMADKLLKHGLDVRHIAREQGRDLADVSPLVLHVTFRPARGKPRKLLVVLAGWSRLHGFTLMGLWAVEAASAAIEKELGHPGSLYIVEIADGASNSAIKRRVMSGLRSAPEGAVVAFAGDVAGSLDGRILPHLNIHPPKRAP